MREPTFTAVLKITSDQQDDQDDTRLAELTTFARRLGLDITAVEDAIVGSEGLVKKGRPGRRPISQAKIRRVLELTEKGMKVPEILKRIPIGRTSIYRIMKGHRSRAPEAAPGSRPVEDTGNITEDDQPCSLIESGINGQASAEPTTPEVGDGTVKEIK